MRFREVLRRPWLPVLGVLVAVLLLLPPQSRATDPGEEIRKQMRQEIHRLVESLGMRNADLLCAEILAAYGGDAEAGRRLVAQGLMKDDPLQVIGALDAWETSNIRSDHHQLLLALNAAAHLRAGVRGSSDEGKSRLRQGARAIAVLSKERRLDTILASRLEVRGVALPPSSPPPPPPRLPPASPPGGEQPPDPVPYGITGGPNAETLYDVLAYRLVLLLVLEARDKDKDDRRTQREPEKRSKVQLKEWLVKLIEMLIARPLTEQEQDQVWKQFLEGRASSEIVARVLAHRGEPQRVDPCAEIGRPDAEPLPETPEMPPAVESARVAASPEERDRPVEPTAEPFRARVCIKSFPWPHQPAGLKFSLPRAAEMERIRERVNRLLDRYEAGDSTLPTGLSDMEASFVARLDHGIDSEQVRLYADYLYLHLLIQERQFDKAEKVAEGVARRYALPSRTFQPDVEVELKGAYFSKRSLVTLIALQGHHAAMQQASGDLEKRLRILATYLDDAETFEPFSRILPGTHQVLLRSIQDATAEQLRRSPLVKLAPETEKETIIFQLIGRRSHTLRIDGVGTRPVVRVLKSQGPG